MKNNESDAVQSARKILEGALLIENNVHTKVRCRLSLVGLDKGVYVGPMYDDDVPAETARELKSLGWCWSEEQESWEFYTGHG